MDFEVIFNIIKIIVVIGIILIIRLGNKRLKNTNDNIENKNEYKIKKDLRFATSMGIISFILSAICIVGILVTIPVGLARDAMETLSLFLLPLLLALPFGLSIILRDIALNVVNKYNDNNIEISNKIICLVKINKIQPKIICITYVVSLVVVIFLQSVVVENIISNELKVKLDEKYGNNYEILREWGKSNEGGENSQRVLLKVGGLDYPVEGRYNIGSRTYSDNYSSVRKNEKENDNFQKNVNTILGEDSISYINKGDNQTAIALIIELDMLENVESCVSNIKLILNKCDNSNIRLYLAAMNEPLYNNEYNYKILASSYANYSYDNIIKYSYLIKKPDLELYNIHINSENILCTYSHLISNQMELSSEDTLYNIIMEWKQDLM